MAGEDGLAAQRLCCPQRCAPGRFSFLKMFWEAAAVAPAPGAVWTLFAARLGILLRTTRAFNSTGNLLKYKSVFANEYL